MESFAEYGSWHQERVTQALTRLIATAPGRIWHGYQVSAVDDTKVHRSSPHVWGTCTFHEYTARCPNRAPTVRAHNWVVLGALLHEPEKPAWFLSISGRLYFRQSQLPIGPDGIVAFQTKCELAVELLREQARIIKGKCGPTAHRGAFSDSASRTFCRLGPTAHRSVWRCKRMLLPALGLPCFRTPRADVVGEPMLEAPRKIQQIAGRNACYGGPPRARLSTPGQCPRRAEGGTKPPPIRAESGGSAQHSGG